jgi:hypothetical protein
MRAPPGLVRAEHLHMCVRLAVAAVLLFAGASKLVAAFGVEAGRPMAALRGVNVAPSVVALVEIATGAGLLRRRWTWPAWSTFVMSVGFAGVLAASLFLEPSGGSCGCFGAVHLPDSAQAALVFGLMLGSWVLLSVKSDPGERCG